MKSIVNGEVTYYVSRQFHLRVSGEETRIQKYYPFGGQPIAVRTQANGADTLNWLLTDHLGSAQVTAAEGGAASGVQRYSAFGEVRSRGGEMPTAYQYTGQLSQMEQVGLYHYGARWFDPDIPQFTQPDQIIPDPYNSLYWNRFAYVRYNAINFNDPSGHKACSSDGDSFDSCTDPLAEPTNWEEIEKTWGIKFEGQDSNGNSTWTEQRKIWTLGAVVATGTRLVEGTNLAAFTAFQMIYAASNPVIFLFGTSLAGHYLSPVCSGIGSGGCTSNDRGTIIINFWDTVHQYSNGDKFMKNVVHELGHAFNSVFSNGPATEYSKTGLGRGAGGFAGGRGQWQFAYTNAETYSEIFADSFVGWTFNRWGNDTAGKGRSNFMNQWIPRYFNLVQEP
ncbi:RHS repeat-associated core domain-containing protein [Levilinea saccharolytica]|uniref:RHS repeat-associated core domain-containing protein n=1 Tax=Levilinea saccharolytica TaxID=229921 RepID=UPI001364C7D4|nr:RHS repeat-associated core domain-containing protein [Levilinea saccharolytica]